MSGQNENTIVLPFDARGEIERVLRDINTTTNPVGTAAQIMRLLMSWRPSGGDQSEPTTPAPRKPRVWQEDDPEPDPHPRVIETADSRQRIYSEDWGGWVLRNEFSESEGSFQWCELPAPITEVLFEVDTTPAGQQ